MRFKTLLFAAAGLLAVANSTSDAPAAASPAYIRGDEPDVAGPTVDAITVREDAHLENAAGPIPPGDCKLNCEIPFQHCLRGCRMIEAACKQICSCELFGNSRNLCVIKRCVPAPSNCKRTKLARSPTKSLVPAAEEPEGASDDAPIPPCVACQTAINICKQRCGGVGPQCDSDCRCYHNEYNRNCDGCDAAACYGSGKADSTSPHISQREHEGTAHDLDPEPAAEQRPPPPPSFCFTCHMAVNMCKKRCGNAPGCDIGCQCEEKHTNFNCKQCNDFHPQCMWTADENDSSHASDVLSPRDGGAVGPSKHDASKLKRGKIDPSKLPPGMIPDPRFACNMCGIETKECTRKCGGSKACEVGCACEKKHEALSCQFCPTFVPKCVF
ncbi:Nn.00g052980.m01.CDS01 [Neocucurbitaria sp. VM-36]